MGEGGGGVAAAAEGHCIWKGGLVQVLEEALVLLPSHLFPWVPFRPPCGDGTAVTVPLQ